MKANINEIRSGLVEAVNMEVNCVLHKAGDKYRLKKGRVPWRYSIGYSDITE
jgi:hypothetical protein